MDKATQRSKILAYFRDHGSMTVRECFEKLYINSPTKRISELRSMGYDIVGIEEVKESNGKTVRYRRYFLRGMNNIPKILEGMKVRFVPSFDRGMNDPYEELVLKMITGTIYYINWEHKCFGVEFDCGDGKQRESFKFFEIGERVSVIG